MGGAKGFGEQFQGEVFGLLGFMLSPCGCFKFGSFFAGLQGIPLLPIRNPKPGTRHPKALNPALSTQNPEAEA